MNEHIVIHDDFRMQELRGKEATVMGRIDDIAIARIDGTKRDVSLLVGEYTRVRTLHRVDAPDGPILVEVAA